jgi:hypothetical protein
MRTTVSLSDGLIQNAKRLAQERGITLSLVVEDALLVYLSQKPAEAIPPFQLHTVRGRLVDPSLDLDRTSALEVSEDEAAFAVRQGQ